MMKNVIDGDIETLKFYIDNIKNNPIFLSKFRKRDFEALIAFNEMSHSNIDIYKLLIDCQELVTESLTDKMTPKTFDEIETAMINAIKEMKSLISNYFNITDNKINSFLNDYFKTFKWSLEQEGKLLKIYMMIGNI